MESIEAKAGLWNSKLKLRFPFRQRARTFIVPTGFGITFGAMVFLLFMIALGYQNNVVYVFVFFLGSVAVSAMINTNSNMDRMDILNPEHSLFFAEENNALNVAIKNRSQIESSGLILKTATESISVASVPAQQTAQIKIHWRPTTRGPQKGPKISLESTYPVGLLRSWRENRSLHLVHVYPARRGVKLLQSAFWSSDLNQAPSLFREHREYQIGDRVNRIDWRKSERQQKTMLKIFEAGETQKTLHFDWEMTASLFDHEKRLSQLCLWLSDADNLGLSYSLQIGDWRSEDSCGIEHLKKCLDQLVAIK